MDEQVGTPQEISSAAAARAAAPTSAQQTEEVAGTAVEKDANKDRAEVKQGSLSTATASRKALQNEQSELYERQTVRLASIDYGELELVRRLFVEPKQYAAFIEQMVPTTGQRQGQQSSDQRVWLVSGPKGSGRKFTALRLALALKEMEGNRAESFWYYLDRGRTLQELAYEVKLPANSVLIFDDVFLTGEMSTKSLLSRDSGINTALKGSKTWFIFTVPGAGSEFPFSEAALQYETLQIGMPDLGEVYRKCVAEYFPLDRYQEDHQMLMGRLDEVRDALQAPCTAADIKYYFCQNLETPAQILRSIQERANAKKADAVERWFDHLPNLNFKLYALLIVLFAGLHVRRINYIYTTAVKQLRKSGMDGSDQFIEPALISQQVLDSVLHLETSGPRIEFVREDYRRVAIGHIEHYYRLLSLVVGVCVTTCYDIAATNHMTEIQLAFLDEQCKLEPSNNVLQRRRRLAEQQYSETWQAREVIAEGIAKIVVHEPDQIRHQIDVLARSDDGFVVMVPASGLAYLAEIEEHRECVLRILTEWAASGDYDLMWACAAAVGRIYVRIADSLNLEDSRQPGFEEPSTNAARLPTTANSFLHDLWDLLAELVAARNQFSNAIQEAVVYSIAYIGWRYAGATVKRIEGWLRCNNGDSPAAQMGRKALIRLLQRSKYLDAAQLEASAYPLLPLLGALIRTDQRSSSTGVNSDPQVRIGLKAVFKWHQLAIGATAGTIEEIEYEEDTYHDNSEVQLDGTAFLPLAAERAARWEKEVLPILLEAITKATQSQREQIRRALLTIWPCAQTHSTERVHYVIRALLTRLHVMNGTPLDLPRTQRMGMFIVDDEACARRRPNAFSLAREISLLTPTVVMRLGDARVRYTFEAPRMQWDGADVRQLTCSTDLNKEDQRGPPLVMPLLQPYRQARQWERTPENTVFVAIYSTAPVIDLADIADTAPPPVAESAQKPSVFARPQAPAAPEACWPWDSKLLLVTPSKQLSAPALPPSMCERIQVLEGNAADECLAWQLRNISRSLHELTQADAMWSDLEHYISVDTQRTASAVAVQVEHWLQLLPAVQPAHPREDTAVTIAWSTLALARDNCEQAVAMVAEMLRDDPRHTPTWRRHVGAACIRLLFNFYDTAPAGASAARHKPLLQLLPALHRAAGDASDVYSVWLLLLKWAKSRDWGDSLLGTSAEAGAMYVGLDSFRRQDAQWLRRQLDEYARQEEDCQARRLAQRLHHHLRWSLAGRIPKLLAGEGSYGIIICEGDNQELAAKAAQLAIHFATLRRSRQILRGAVLTLHWLGSEELACFVRTHVEATAVDLYDGHRRLPLIGPILERYASAQVSFAVILTNQYVIDYDDWAENKPWQDRLWIIGLSGERDSVQGAGHREMAPGLGALLASLRD